MHSFRIRDAASLNHNTGKEVLLTPSVVNRACSVMFSKGWGTSPEADRLHTVAAALTLQETQASSAGSAAFFTPLVHHGSLHGRGAQAWWPTWSIHDVSAAFYAAYRSSECRHGVGEKNGGSVGPAAVGW